MKFLLTLLAVVIAIAFVPGCLGKSRADDCLEDIMLKEQCQRPYKHSRRFFNTTSCRCETQKQCLDGNNKFKTKGDCNRVCGENRANGYIGRWSKWSSCTKLSTETECIQTRRRSCSPQRKNPCGCRDVKLRDQRTVTYKETTTLEPTTQQPTTLNSTTQQPTTLNSTTQQPTTLVQTTLNQTLI